MMTWLWQWLSLHILCKKYWQYLGLNPYVTDKHLQIGRFNQSSKEKDRSIWNQMNSKFEVNYWNGCLIYQYQTNIRRSFSKHHHRFDVKRYIHIRSLWRRQIKVAHIACIIKASVLNISSLPQYWCIYLLKSYLGNTLALNTIRFWCEYISSIKFKSIIW